MVNNREKVQIKWQSINKIVAVLKFFEFVDLMRRFLKMRPIVVIILRLLAFNFTIVLPRFPSKDNEIKIKIMEAVTIKAIVKISQ